MLARVRLNTDNDRCGANWGHREQRAHRETLEEEMDRVRLIVTNYPNWMLVTNGVAIGRGWGSGSRERLV